MDSGKDLKNKYLRKIVSDSAIVFSAKVLSVIFGLVFNLIVSNIYGAQSLGSLALVNSFFAIALIPSLMGFQTSILRFMPEYEGKYNYATAISVLKQVIHYVLFFSLIVAIVSYFSSSFIASTIFKKPSLDWIFSVASIFLVFRALMLINQHAVRALQSVKHFSYIAMAFPLFNIFIVLILYEYSESEYDPIFSIFISSVLTFVLSFLLLKNSIDKDKASGEIEYESKRGRVLLRISSPMFITSALGVVIAQTDIVMLGMYMSLEDVGHYAIAVKLATLTSFVIQSINTVIAPDFSKFYHSGNREHLDFAIGSSTRMIFWITLPISLFIMAFGDYFLSLFGEGFVVAYYSLVFLLLGRLIAASCGSVGYLLNMTGYHKINLYIQALSAVFNVALNYILIPLYGIAGAAVSSMVAVAMSNLLSSFYLYRKEKIVTIYLFRKIL